MAEMVSLLCAKRETSIPQTQGLVVCGNPAPSRAIKPVTDARHGISSSTSESGSNSAKPPGGRLIELDILRGFLLLWMTLTHLPTAASIISNQTFGFVSGAEGFIFLSAFMVGQLEHRMEEKRGRLGGAARFGQAHRESVSVSLRLARDCFRGARADRRALSSGWLFRICCRTIWPTRSMR